MNNARVAGLGERTPLAAIFRFRFRTKGFLEMRRRFVLAIATLMAIGSVYAAQLGTTTDVFKVWCDKGKWYGRNVSQQDITAYVIHVGGGDLHVTTTLITVAPGEMEYQPISPGQVVEVRVKPSPMVDIPAVILANGVVIGSAKTVEGLDVVEEIFKYRAEEHNEYVRLAALLHQSDPGRAMSDFRAELNRPLSGVSSEQATGIGRARTHMQGFGDSDYTVVLQEVEKCAAFTAKSSTRRAQ
jgi:hypothetical protein